MTEKLIVTVDNGTRRITFGDSSCDFRLLEYSGFAAADYDVQYSAGGSSDGGYITSARLSSRTLYMKSEFAGADAESVRQRLISFFSPKKTLTVTAKRGKTVRTITGTACDFDVKEANRFGPSVFPVSILCPDPYFKASGSVEVSAAVYTPLLYFPQEGTYFPLEGRVFSSQSSTGRLDVTNTGDTYADMVAELVANAAVTKPYIKNLTNGKKIGITGSLAAGKTMRVSTVRRAKGITVTGATCYIDSASEFADFLEVGLNELEYGSDEGSSNISASVRFTELFSGV